MLSRRLLLLALTAAAASAYAAPPPAAAARFPQPVSVGALIGRDVLKPTEAQRVLGRVDAITRQDDGSLDALMQFGGILGFNTRRIAVPLSAMALMGEFMAVMDLTPAQLQALPTAPPPGTSALPPNTVIRVGIVGPFH